VAESGRRIEKRSDAEHPATAAKHDAGCQKQHDRTADQPQQQAADVDQRGDLIGNGQQRDRSDAGKPEAEGNRHERDDTTDVLRRQAEPGIGAVTDRAAAEGTEPGSVADGIGAEGGQCDLRERQLPADIFDGVDVVEDQREKAEAVKNSASRIELVLVSASACTTSS
jgi:hypothetical protein